MTEDKHRDLPRPGETWKHYKGGLYLILCIANHTEYEDVSLVVYGDGRQYWARPLTMFMSTVSDPPSKKRINRFERHYFEEFKLEFEKDFGSDEKDTDKWAILGVDLASERDFETKYAERLTEPDWEEVPEVESITGILNKEEDK